MTRSVLRRELLARRSTLTPAARRRAAIGLAEAVLPLALRADQTASYVSIGTEPPTGHLLDALAGRCVLLPVLRPDGDLDWADAAGGLAPGPRGLRQPTGPRLGVQAVAGCALVLVPALAVDRSGTRLGRGGGSYDRALTRATGRIVALLYDGELLDVLPREPHDVPVHAVITPADGLLELRPWPPGGTAA